MKLVKLYTIIIGAAFIFGVGYSLISDAVINGVSLETFHKLLHIGIGVWAAFILFKKTRQERTFVWTNTILWGAFATVGWLLPDFLGLAAFNLQDRILHTIVAGTGVIALLQK